MQPMTVREITAATGGVWWNQGERMPEIASVSTDSRKITAGCLFVPIKGENHDGHAYIETALDAGAAGVLCSRLPSNLRADKFYIKVDDTRLALKALAGYYRQKFNIPFVQVTGSVGKTTTKDMIASVLSSRYPVLKTPENFNNDIGVPLTLLSLEPEHQAAVIETGMNHFGEIRYLGEMVRPDVAVITNIGDAHIEYLGSRQGILKAKSEIFDNLRPGGTAILNGDDALLDTLTLPVPIIRCGQAEHCGVRITDLADHGVQGITCTVTTKKDKYQLSIPAPGEHMAYSASIAVAVGEKLGLNHEEIVRGVAAYQSTGSRMHIIRLPRGRTILDDCYNANPQSVTAALEILARTDCEQKIAVLGDMGELGALTNQAHYNMGALAAMLGVDQIFAVGTKAAQIAAGAEESGGTVQYFATKEEALPAIAASFKAGSAMLVKASHAMAFGWLVEELSR